MQHVSLKETASVASLCFALHPIGISARCRENRILAAAGQPALNLKGAFQATVRSATSTLPLVSGLNSTATRKMAKADLGEPTTLEAELRVIFATLGFVA